MTPIADDIIIVKHSEIITSVFCGLSKNPMSNLKVWLHIYILAGPIKTEIIEKLGSILGPLGIFSKKNYKRLPRLPENIEKMAKSNKRAGAHLHYIS